MDNSCLDYFFDYHPQKNIIKMMSPGTYYQPFRSSFDPEFGQLAATKTMDADIWRQIPNENLPLAGHNNRVLHASPAIVGTKRLNFWHDGGYRLENSSAENHQRELINPANLSQQLERSLVINTNGFQDFESASNSNSSSGNEGSSSTLYKSNSEPSPVSPPAGFNSSSFGGSLTEKVVRGSLYPVVEPRPFVSVADAAMDRLSPVVLRAVNKDPQLQLNGSNGNSARLGGHGTVSPIQSVSSRHSFDRSSSSSSRKSSKLYAQSDNSVCSMEITSQQLNRIRTYAESTKGVKVKGCNFCRNNKEVPDIYLTHYLYDPVTKVLSCPVLRKHVCEICGDTGDRAHTLQYCPVNRERGGGQGKIAVLLKTRTVTNSTGKIRRN